MEESVFLEVSGDPYPQISLGWTEPNRPKFLIMKGDDF